MKKLFLFWLLMAIAGSAHAVTGGTYTASFALDDLSSGSVEKLGTDEATSIAIVIGGDLWKEGEEIALSEFSDITVGISMYGITKIEIPVTSDSQLEATTGTLTKKKSKYVWTCPDGEIVNDITFLPLNRFVINGTIVVTYDTRLKLPAKYTAISTHYKSFGMHYTKEGSWKGGRRIAILPGVSITTGSSDDTQWGVETVKSSKCALSGSLLKVENDIPVTGTFFKIEPRVNVAVNFKGNFPVGTYCLVDKNGKVVFEKEVTDSTTDVNMFEYYSDDNGEYACHSFLEGSAGPYYFYDKDAEGHCTRFGLSGMEFHPVFAFNSSNGAKVVNQIDMPTNSTVQMPRISSDSGIDCLLVGALDQNGSNIVSGKTERVGNYVSSSWSSEVVDANDTSVAEEDKKLHSLTMTYNIPVNVYDKSKMYTVPSTGKVKPCTQVTSVPGITMTYGGWLTNYNKDKYVSDDYEHDSDFQPIDDTNIYDDKGIHLMDNNYLRTDRIAMNHRGAYEDWMNNKERYHVFRGNFFKFEPSQSGKLTIYAFTNGATDEDNDGNYDPKAHADLYLIDEKCGVVYKNSDNPGYSKFTVDVHAGKTYSFFGTSPKSGLCGFYFDPTAVESTSVVTLSDENGIESSSVKGKAARVVYSDRTFKENTWTSIVLPFSMNEKQVAAAFGEGTKVIYFDRLNNDTLKFLHYIYDYIIGGTICFIRPTKTVTGIDLSSAGDYQYVTYFGDELFGGSYATLYSTSDGSSYMLDGGYDVYYSLAAYDYYLTNNGTLKYLAKGKAATIKPFRGFFRYLAGSNAKAFSPLMMEGLDDMVTEIENRQIIETSISEDNSYNLQGQRVSNTYKGVVIQKNKRFLRK